MTVAVGRLQFSITRRAPHPVSMSKTEIPVESFLERAARKERLFEEAAADRSRWMDVMLARTGRPF